MKTRQKQELKVSFKRVLIYLCILFPFILLSTASFAAIGVDSSPLVIFMDVLIGASLCFLFEIIYVKIKDKKAEKEEFLPKKHDPFAD